MKTITETQPPAEVFHRLSHLLGTQDYCALKRVEEWTLRKGETTEHQLDWSAYHMTLGWSDNFPTPEAAVDSLRNDERLEQLALEKDREAAALRALKTAPPAAVISDAPAAAPVLPRAA